MSAVPGRSSYAEGRTSILVAAVLVVATVVVQ